MLLQKTKKCLLGILTAGVVACCGLIFVNNSIEAKAATSKLASFAMKDGAYVRVDGNYDDNGMRFKANISQTDFESLTNPTVGMFIMPKAYLKHGMLNAETTFGDSAVYTWEGDGKENTEGKKKILHVKTTPTLEGTVYEIKGSVVSMKKANLNLDYIAQAYIYADGVYYFAEDTQTALEEDARSMVTISQNALITRSDWGNSQKEALTDYLTAYIEAEETAGRTVARTITKDVYIEKMTDRQTVSMRFEDGITATLTMQGFAATTTDRTTAVYGTKGVVEGKFNEGKITVKIFGKEPYVIDFNENIVDKESHNGGDAKLVDDYVKYKLGKEKPLGVSLAIDSLYSHRLAFSAEESRILGGKPVRVEKDI